MPSVNDVFFKSMMEEIFNLETPGKAPTVVVEEVVPARVSTPKEQIISTINSD